MTEHAFDTVPSIFFHGVSSAVCLSSSSLSLSLSSKLQYYLDAEQAGVLLGEEQLHAQQQRAQNVIDVGVDELAAA